MAKTDSGLWVPSDDLLGQDPIAIAKVLAPFDPPDLEGAGVVLPDRDDDTNEVLAAAVLAEEFGDDDARPDGSGACDDDDEVLDDFSDTDPIGDV